jgi:toxin secretion/phage lysis holin
MKLSAILAAAGVPITFLFGEWTPFMDVLLVLMALDIVTGIVKAISQKNIRSRKMSNGLLRKSGIFLVLILGNMLDIVLFNGLPVVKSALVFFYIGMEGISLVENLHALGVPIPNFIGKYLETIKEKGEIPEEIEVDAVKLVQADTEIEVKTES